MIVKVILCHTNIVLHINIYIITLYTSVKPKKDRYIVTIISIILYEMYYVLTIVYNMHTNIYY